MLQYLQQRLDICAGVCGWFCLGCSVITPCLFIGQWPEAAAKRALIERTVLKRDLLFKPFFYLIVYHATTLAVSTARCVGRE
jgi:hypothetical protein